MSLTDAPPDVTALAAMLALCPSWVGATGTIWYPDVDPSTSGTLALIAPVDERRTRYAEGAVPIPGGTLMIVLHGDNTVGAVETLARALQKELLTFTTGLLLRSAQVGRCAEPGPARVAGGESREVIAITVEYGLNA